MERLIGRPLGAVLCLLLVAACGPTATTITTPSPGIVGPPLPSAGVGSPVVVGTPGPAPTISVPPDSRWQLLSDFPAQGAYEVVSIIAGDGGFVAAGSTSVPGEGYYGRSQGLIWTSADGQNWQVNADPGLLYSEPLDMAVLGADRYILGDYEPCAEGNPSCADAARAGNAVYRSSAGGGWQMLPQAANLQTAYVDGLVAGHGQLLIFGGADDDAGTTTVWRSSDGTNWTSFAAPDLEQVTAMTATSSGFVMFAATYNGSNDVQGLVARSSTDGSNFSPLTLPDVSSLQYAEIDSVAARGNSVVGVGYGQDSDGNDVGLALFSPDGTSWSVAHDTDGSFAGVELAGVEAIANGYLAFGYVYQTDAGQVEPRAWYSADGLNWRGLPPVPGSFTDATTWAASSQAAVYFTDIENDSSTQDVAISLYPWYAPLGQLLAP